MDELIKDGHHYDCALNIICDDYETGGWTKAHNILDEALDKIVQEQADMLKSSLKCSGIFGIEHTDDGYKITVKIPPTHYYHYGVATVKT